MCDHMRQDGYVSVPRRELAKMLGCHERKVSEHIAAAVNAGLLARVSRGYVGHTAVFRAVLPAERVPTSSTLSTSQRVPKAITLSTPRNRHPLHAQEGAE